MSKEMEKILTLLNEKKITQEEFGDLKQALQRPSQKTNMFKYMIDPFESFSALQSLFIGFFVLAAMSLLASKIKIYYPGVLDFKITEGALGFSTLFMQNLIVTASIGVVFIFTAIFLKQKNMRTLDFAGTVLFARFPYFLVTLALYLMFIAGWNLNIEGLNSAKDYAILIIVLSGLFWQVVVYFNAFKFASGLQDAKLTGAYIFSLVFSEIISILILTNL